MERNQLPSNIHPTHYDIYIRPDPGFFVQSDLRLRFEGAVQIKIEVVEATSEVMLNATELTLHRALLDGEDSAAIVTNDVDQTATLVFGQTIPVGTHVLSIDYTGKIALGAQGLFVSEYDTPTGRKRLLVTQFEAGDARRFVPCWDEPARKATFTVAVAAPSNKLTVSNMPIETVSTLDDDRQYVRFRKTPRMSTYLLFLCIGDLERISTVSGATVISLVAKAGSAEDGRFALDSAARLLEFYNDYFGVPYPLPKLDMIAAPGAGGFSAMENWGAILYFEDQLLLNPEWSTESNRQRVFVVIAHEMAHQWFGNLVTMEWWDNLWLNEGFASWMESKATDQFHPDWMNWLQSEFDLQRAMRQDAKHTTHPVVQPVVSVEQAAFDDITYRKGRAVIRMIENFVGPEAFRSGVQAYMKRYGYKNTVTDNLWDELEKASGKKIKQIAADFTTKPGIPLILVESETTGTGGVEICVRERRFAVDDSADEPATWTVPVYASAIGARDPVLTLVHGDQTKLLVPGAVPIKLNSGQTVYYRVKYDSGYSELVNALDRLAPADQLGLLNDAWAIGEAGAVTISNYLDLTLKLTPSTDRVVWRQAIETLLAIDSLYDPGARRNAFRAFARSCLQAVFAGIGWGRKTTETDNETVLREFLITGLAQLDDLDVKLEAQRRFAAYAGPPVDPSTLPAAIRRPALVAAAISADTNLYGRLYDLAKSTTDSFGKDQLFLALASTEDAALAQRSLDIALGDDPAKTTGPKMIQRVAVTHADLAWHFALTNLPKINERLDELQQLSFVPSLTAASRSPQVLEELQRYITEKVRPNSRKSAERYVADLTFRLQVIGRLLPAVDTWLTTHR
ncbi:M1 family metallopeptidase [Bradyrhizobium ontarionense]|uniref:Aminopeptidase n=1 Tax=Bradyrhizobium ontarionense TaxID=2898149 RepID=A0ABY3RMA1_9BRAD|nr:M1 family metallopeptidase [Bradyrhizobium sp. A19]UFZ08025.1 M1 family metallopeptidase [Bradyrhizobium sp. A19]